MSEQLELVPDEREVDHADLEAAQNDVAEPEAEAPEGEEEQSAAPDDDQGDDDTERKSRSDKRKEKIKAEIDALTREKYEAQRQAEQTRQQLEEMQQWVRQQQAPPQYGEMPKLADFDYDEGRYQQAVQQWHVSNLQQVQEQQNMAAQQYQQQIHAQREAQTLQAKIAEGTKKYPDFAVKVNDPSLPPLREVNPAAFQAVMESDAGVDVAYYLANNPSDVYALAQMSPMQAIKRVTQLEAMVAKQPPSAATLAPRPPSTLKGSAGTVKDPSKMSTDEWMKWRNKQTAKQQKR